MWRLEFNNRDSDQSKTAAPNPNIVAGTETSNKTLGSIFTGVGILLSDGT